ncbi:Flavin-linked sulfhydryl oxidase of the mitochondrial IMS [Mycoemilia scoparia]|uniref:Sulfhydryl oxidase n=1 Tax=Mycoemilia scoparia TaxID=417184 RepID=A0A9W8A7P5_9FUNG|nr:Flavin-linked sulfhydryl oxidase of the mitochondrial IMS [Mycoemilia scoparia]
MSFDNLFNTNKEDNANTKEKKPCRVCDSFKNWRHNEAKHQKAQEKNTHDDTKLKSSASTTTLVGAAAGTTATAVGSVESYSSKAENDKSECPPDSMVLGRATWTFLHTMAAYYPDKPSQNQQSMMKDLLQSFSHFYPCQWCASHLRSEMAKEPPDTSTRWGLSQWMCRMHNKVNVNQGKDEFDCSKVDERWRDGPKNGSCDE